MIDRQVNCMTLCGMKFFELFLDLVEVRGFYGIVHEVEFLSVLNDVQKYKRCRLLKGHFQF